MEPVEPRIAIFFTLVFSQIGVTGHTGLVTIYPVEVSLLPKPSTRLLGDAVKCYPTEGVVSERVSNRHRNDREGGLVKEGLPVPQQKGVPQDGGGEQEGVDAVEDAAMAGKEGSGIFDAGAAFDGGFQEVA